MTDVALHPEHGALVHVLVDNPAWVKDDPNLSGDLGIGVPRPKSGWAIVDTGASCSCCTVQVAEALNLLQVDALEFRGVQSGHDRERPDRQFARVRFGVLEVSAANKRFSVRFAEVQRLGEHAGEPIIALIGRDVLRHANLTWKGPAQAFHLDFSDAAPVPSRPERSGDAAL